MSTIIKVITGSCDFIVEQEYPNEDAAMSDQHNELTNATFTNVKIFNVKYKQGKKEEK